MDNLKRIVLELENGNLSLSDSLEKYEEGIARLKQCHDALADAQQKIELLVDLDENGNARTKPFDVTSTAENSSGVRRTTTVDLSEEEWEDDELEDESDEAEDDYNELF